MSPSPMAPVYAALAGLVAVLLIAIGLVSWGMPASPFLLAGGGLLLAGCAGVVLRARGSA